MSRSWLDERLRELAREHYNVPPATPREAMWARIEAARRQARGRQRGGVRAAWVGWGVGLAAMLALGIGLGRLTVERAPAPGIAQAPATDSPLSPPVGRAEPDPAPPEIREHRGGEVEAPPAPRVRARAREGAPAGTREPRRATPAPNPSLAYRVAAVHALGQAEALLTSFRVDARQGQVDPQVLSWAREVLSNTRLLLDSPAAEDPQIQGLLEDLELVLVQIVQLAGKAPEDEELEWIGQALEQRDLLPRLRAAVPPGPPVMGT